jgi:hypothetical protein
MTARQVRARSSGGGGGADYLGRQRDEVELDLAREEGRTSIDLSEFSEFQKVRGRAQHAEVAGEDAVTRCEEDAFTAHVQPRPALGVWPCTGGAESLVSRPDECVECALVQRDEYQDRGDRMVSEAATRPSLGQKPVIAAQARELLCGRAVRSYSRSTAWRGS